MHRYRFLLFRPLQLLPVLLGISLITFMMVRAIPGDPARILLGVRSTPAALARIRAQFALDEPLWVQYGYFLRNLLQGGFLAGLTAAYFGHVVDLTQIVQARGVAPV